MPTINATTMYRNYAINTAGSWPGARDSSTGTATNMGGGSLNAIIVIKDSGRGAGTFAVARLYVKFNTSAISVLPSTANIKFTTQQRNDLPNLSIVKATADGSSTNDHNAITGYSAGNTMAGNVTDYAASNTPAADVSAEPLGTTFSIVGSSTLKEDMRDNSTVIMAFVQYTNDYTNTIPASNGFFDLGLTTLAGTQLEYTLPGYGKDVIGVTSSDIVEVSGVATGDIVDVIGVS